MLEGVVIRNTTKFSTLLKTQIIILSTLILSSANAFNLDQSKYLSFGKEFIGGSENPFHEKT